MLILGRHHLLVVLEEFVDHYNTHRPHRSLGQLAPCSSVCIDTSTTTPTGRVERVVRADRLGGLVHEYRLVA
jgi:hypothetical protein